MKALTILMLALASTASANEVARVIYNEARGEGERGMRAVATVIHNRTLRSPHTSGSGRNAELLKVVSAPHQFAGYQRALTSADVPSPSYRLALRIARELELGTFIPLGNWTHFYNPKLANPKWGSKLTDVVIIGNHKFGRTK